MPKPANANTRWTSRQVRVLKENKNLPDKMIAQIEKRTNNAIREKRSELHLKKDK